LLLEGISHAKLIANIVNFKQILWRVLGWLNFPVAEILQTHPKKISLYQDPLIVLKPGSRFLSQSPIIIFRVMAFVFGSVIYFLFFETKCKENLGRIRRHKQLHIC